MTAQKWSEVDWGDGTPNAILQERSFFPYSGEDGDLFRKHGLAGWRVSVYGRYLVRIQKKRDPPIGGWATKESWEVEPETELSTEQIEDFADALDHLIEHGELP